MDQYIKTRLTKLVSIVTVCLVLYFLYEQTKTEYNNKNVPNKTIPKNNASISEPHSKIDIIDRVYTIREVEDAFDVNLFRATNYFSKCKIMVIGRVADIGFAPFSSNPLVELRTTKTPGKIFFEFENDHNVKDYLENFKAGDVMIIAGENARRGPLGGIFIEKSAVMIDLISEKTNEMLVLAGGKFDKEVCNKKLYVRS